MTETNMNTSNPYDGERVAGTVGFPLPGVSLRIADPDTGATLPQGEIGMIEVKGPNVFKGYWRMPEKTASEFRADGFFITGDLGKIDADGYVHIVGRGKDLDHLRRLQRLSEGDRERDRRDAGRGRKRGDRRARIPISARASRRSSCSASGAHLDEAAILSALDGRLAKFKQPKRVLFVDDLPRNAMGKVQKAALREAYKGIYLEQGGAATKSARGD